jgi:hypothetical protein
MEMAGSGSPGDTCSGGSTRAAGDGEGSIAGSAEGSSVAGNAVGDEICGEGAADDGGVGGAELCVS